MPLTCEGPQLRRRCPLRTCQEKLAADRDGLIAWPSIRCDDSSGSRRPDKASPDPSTEQAPWAVPETGLTAVPQRGTEQEGFSESTPGRARRPSGEALHAHPYPASGGDRHGRGWAWQRNTRRRRSGDEHEGKGCSVQPSVRKEPGIREGRGPGESRPGRRAVSPWRPVRDSNSCYRRERAMS
jgi:hypothetical protein